MHRNTILVIDDEEDLRSITKEILEREGFTMIDSGDGEEAYMLIRKWHDKIDLVLLDMRLPGMSGEQLIEKINEYQVKPKIIILSAYQNHYEKDDLVMMNVYDYLIKPFDIKCLVSSVINVLNV